MKPITSGIANEFLIRFKTEGGLIKSRIVAGSSNNNALSRLFSLEPEADPISIQLWDGNASRDAERRIVRQTEWKVGGYN